MIIDAHAHSAGNYSSKESILEMATRYSIQKIFLCPGPKNSQEARESPALPLPKKPDSNYMVNKLLRWSYKSFIPDNGDGNEFVNGLYRQLPDLIVPFLWVNPLSEADIASLDDKIHAYAIRGIKLHQAWNAFDIDGPGFATINEIARKYDMPIFMHLYSRRDVGKLKKFCGRNDYARIIIGHLSGMDVMKGAGLKSIFYDVSGSDRVRARDIQTAIDDFGPDHVLFGSDTPYADFAKELAKMESLRLTASVRDAVYYGNALSIIDGVNIHR